MIEKNYTILVILTNYFTENSFSVRDKKYNDRYCKDRSRNTRDEVNNKDQGRDNRDGNRYKEKRDYRDSRMSKELNSSSSSLKDRSFRERDSRDLSSSNGKYRSNSGMK